MEQMGVGVVGYGAATRTFHIPLLRLEERRSGCVALRCIVSSRPDVVRREHPGVAVTSSVDDLLDRDDIAIVVIAGKNSEHHSCAKRALVKNKHVVMEKPMTITSSEADELLALSAEHGRALTVFHNRRWDNGTLTLEKLLGDHVLGELSNCCFRYDRFVPEPKAGWREDRQPGSGMVYDLGSHLIFASLTLFGAPEFLSADIAVQRSRGRVDDYFDITLGYGTLRVQLRSSMLAPANDLVIEAHGSKGSFQKFGLDPQVALLQSGDAPDSESWNGYRGSDYGTLSTVTAHNSIEGTRLALKPGTYEAFYSGVVAAVVHGAPPPILPSLARDTVALIEAAYVSSREGRRISSDELGLLT